MPDHVGTVGVWLEGTGPESDIVVSSRIRLARNVVGFPLKARLGTDESDVLCDHLRSRIDAANVQPDLRYISVHELTDVQRQVLVERHLISLEHANSEGSRAVVCDEAGSLALMLNEEDHLRLQVIGSGLCLDETFERSQAVSRKLESVLDFAFHDRFGYLTSCPTNVGTGMRISVMLHLPALVLVKQIDKVFNSVAKMNLAVRGFYGEGTKALSDFYQISNQVTLGKTPDALLEDVRRVLPKIVSFERQVRDKTLSESDRVLIEDRVWRAYGQLAHARSIASEEVFEHLSMVRMGVHLGLIDRLDVPTVNRLFMLGQPGHLQEAYGGSALDSRERDILRAEMIRREIQGGSGGR